MWFLNQVICIVFSNYVLGIYNKHLWPCLCALLLKMTKILFDDNCVAAAFYLEQRGVIFCAPFQL